MKSTVFPIIDDSPEGPEAYRSVQRAPNTAIQFEPLPRGNRTLRSSLTPRPTTSEARSVRINFTVFMLRAVETPTSPDADCT